MGKGWWNQVDVRQYSTIASAVRQYWPLQSHTNTGQETDVLTGGSISASDQVGLVAEIRKAVGQVVEDGAVLNFDEVDNVSVDIAQDGGNLVVVVDSRLRIGPGAGAGACDGSAARFCAEGECRQN